MKNYWKSLTLVLVGVFALSSCDDVPTPYPVPIHEGDATPTVFEPEGEGTQASPYNVAAARGVCDNLEQTTDNANKHLSPEVYVKGIISKIDEVDTSYGSSTFYISDDGSNKNEFEVYRGYYLNGEKFTSEDQIAVGDTVVISGQLLNFKGTYEFNQGSKIVSLNGNGSNVGPEPQTDLTGDGTKEKPYTVTDVTTIYASTPTKTGVWVKGFIVGYVVGQKLDEGANFSATGNVAASNILLAESADETDYTKCLAIQLPIGDVRTRINLKDNPANLKAEVSLYGDIDKYFGVAGLKNTSKYVIGNETNDNGNEPAPGEGSPIDQDFTKGQGTWAIQNVNLGGVSYVWQQSAQYGMKASAFVNSTNNATEAWIISPAFEVTTQKTITFNNCMNYLKSGTMSDHIAVMVSTNYSSGLPSTAEWTALTFTPQPDGKSWNWVDSKADISSFAGKTIHVAFKYVSTTTVAPTWEIKKVSAE